MSEAMESCASCRFRGPGEMRDEWNLLCKRHSPVAVIVGDTRYPTAEPRWPKVTGRDWCGDYERTFQT